MHGLTRGTFNEVVDRRQDEQRRLANSGDVTRGDPHHVSPHHIAKRGRLGSDFDERLAGELIAPRGKRIRYRLRHRDGDRRENSSRDWKQVRREYQVGVGSGSLENGPHLRQVAVSVGNPVCPEVLSHLTEQQVGAGSQSRAGHTACCRGVYGTARCYEAPLRERDECHEDGSRVAARVCHDGGISELSPYELRESVRDVARPVARTEVGREIDGPCSGTADARDPGRRRTVWKRREHELGVRQRRVIVRDKADVGAAEPRQLAASLVRGCEREPHPRVSRNERAQLASGVAAPTEDSNRDSMHDECILLHQRDVNCGGPGSVRPERCSRVLPLDPAPCYRLVDRYGGGWVDKRKRHAAILELVGGQAVGSQEELRVLLHRRGWDVTQSTLSRDLRELRLARVPTPEGVRYAVADGAISSAARPALDALLPQLLTRVDGVGELIVVRTVPGGAQPVASALDGESWPDVLGTVGGDDTILVVCRSAAARERLERRLRKLAEI